jgi:hypothetical protein
MKRPATALVLALALVSVDGCAFGDGPPDGDGGGTLDGAGGGAVDLAVASTGNAEADAWLAAHNAVRAGAMPAPSPPLPPLGWSAPAAQVAATWAAGCTFSHNSARGNYGENIFANTGSTATPADVVRSWASEAANYTYATNSCAVGKSCGHYTQIVWGATTAVGCATRVCTTNCPFSRCINGSWNFSVCDYSPPGNSGGKPY